jgi:hypothetical protein
MSPLSVTAARAAAIAVMLWLMAQAGHTMFLCAPHRAWTRVHSGRSEVVVERSERIARADDAIFVCETVHRTGPIVWHLDLECYCAPAIMSPERLGDAIGGSCTVDKLRPRPDDDSGACRYGRCGRHFE